MNGVSRRGLLGGALALGGCSGLETLNSVDDLWPGDADVVTLAEDVPFGTDPRQRLDVHAPKGAAKAPVLVFFYGGSWASGRRQDYRFAGRALAAQGFVTVVPDYRLVPQVRFPAFLEDGAAALAWTAANIARFGGNPAAIGVSGHSAGAWIAMMLALDRRWLAAAGAPGVVKAAAGLAGPYDFLPFKPGGATAMALGNAPDPGRTQPVRFVSAGAPPARLLTGDADTTVKPRNSLSLAAAMTKAGASGTVRLYPGIGHTGILLALSKPFRGRAAVLEDMTQFLRLQLKS
jgi:acetyl esterase/lipase